MKGLGTQSNDAYPHLMGQCAGVIHDVKPAKEILHGMVTIAVHLSEGAAAVGWGVRVGKPRLGRCVRSRISNEHIVGRRIEADLWSQIFISQQSLF